eukprot:TRINITY_DN3238_c0_g1_i10.p1 TRINITY_DN3238_c0_g1~~TRINITY_DN3238_c0_g1_i10.p1  ORF type:complete len:437 (-),score=62.88 TRINITY_DN3238_c0_g1_i10:160-1470(-)
MRRRIAEYSKIKLSNHNKGIQNLRNSSDHNSEEVTSNQQSNVDDKREGAIIKNTSPFIQNTTKNNNQNKNSDVNNDNNNDSNEKENLNNAKIIQIDSSLWKNLDQIENDDDNENSNDDENGAGFNDSVSGDSEKNKHQLHQKQQQDENDDDIWSEFQTKEEIQQQKILFFSNLRLQSHNTKQDLMMENTEYNQSQDKSTENQDHCRVNRYELQQAYLDVLQCSTNNQQNYNTFSPITPTQSSPSQLFNRNGWEKLIKVDDIVEGQQMSETFSKNSEIQGSCCGSNEVTPINQKLFEALENAILQKEFLEKLEAVSMDRSENGFVFLEDEIEPDYVLVGQHEVIQAMSMYIAEYLYTLPEAKKLAPEDLHLALIKAFKELKQNHWKAVWSLGSNLYKGVQLACGTALMLENPWLIRAVGVFLWVFAKFLWYIPFMVV